MWRGKRDTEAQELDIPAVAYASSPVSRASRRGWQRLPSSFPGWLRGSLLAAILIGFPVSNVIFFLSLNQFSPDSAMEGEPSRHPSSHAAHNEVPQAGAHSMGTADIWEDLASKVVRDDLFARYQPYFNSETRALQGYGRVLVVSDAFLGPVDASGPATAMTTLSEVLPGPCRDNSYVYNCMLSA